MSLKVDHLLHGRYRIVRKIKSGGMGAVYEACDTKLADSPCAIKEILESARLGANADYVQTRFYEEMKALSSLDHPCIPRVRDYLTTDATIYIVMDLVQGRSLSEELKQADGRQPHKKVVQDVVQLLDTLQYLHEHQPPIVHRDVKPANVLRDLRTGGIKLVDFGLARQVDRDDTQTSVGTIGYCAPEQLRGKADTRSDIFSVGMTMCHMLTGEAPPMLLYEPEQMEKASPPVPSALKKIVERATQPNPGDRYATAAEMIGELQAWLEEKLPQQTTVQVRATEPVAQPVPDPAELVPPNAFTTSTKQLRQRSLRSRDQSLNEKWLLVESILTSRQRTAESVVMERILEAQKQLQARMMKAAERGRAETALVRLSAHLFDLRTEFLEELNRSSERTPDPYPQLRKEGPFTFGQVGRWLEHELQLPDPENTSPLPWLESLANWLLERESAGRLARLFKRHPPLPPILDDLYHQCQREGLRPTFRFYELVNDRGIDLKVSW